MRDWVVDKRAKSRAKDSEETRKFEPCFPLQADPEAHKDETKRRVNRNVLCTENCEVQKLKKKIRTETPVYQAWCSDTLGRFIGICSICSCLLVH